MYKSPVFLSNLRPRGRPHCGSTFHCLDVEESTPFAQSFSDLGRIQFSLQVTWIRKKKIGYVWKCFSFLRFHVFGERTEISETTLLCFMSLILSHKSSFHSSNMSSCFLIMVVQKKNSCFQRKISPTFFFSCAWSKQ